MWSVLKRLPIHRIESGLSLIKETKRFAGHSKWANIKHIKAEKDHERATLFARFAQQMRVAIAEEGSPKPSDNSRLARIIEAAKKKSMPQATINAVLEKATKAATKAQTATLDIKGPGGCVIIIELLTDNLKGLRMLLATVFKKNGAVVVDQSVRHVFNHRGIIISEMMGNLDSATEDAINVGAEDVEEIDIDGVKHYQFTCEASVLPKVTNQLSSRNYNIISSEALFIPKIFANLSDTDVDRVAVLCAKLEAFDEVVRLHDNIA